MLVNFFKTIYFFREYLKQSVARDLRKRYKRSFLGYLWSMLNPLFMMLILAIVFSNIMRVEMKDYAIYVLTGMTFWSFFNATCIGSLGSIRANAPILAQLPVPKYLFSISTAFSNLVDFFLAIVPLLFIILVLQFTLPFSILLLPVILLPIFMFTLGVAFILAVLNVFFEDTQHLTTVALQALYFLSPILYPAELLPEWVRGWIVLNPLFHLVEMMQAIFYHGQAPDWNQYAISCLVGFVTLLIGLWAFKVADKKFVYYI